MAIPLAKQVAELKREAAMRAHVYPRLIASGKLKQADADHQRACLDAAIATLVDLQAMLRT